MQSAKGGGARPQTMGYIGGCDQEEGVIEYSLPQTLNRKLSSRSSTTARQSSSSTSSTLTHSLALFLSISPSTPPPLPLSLTFTYSLTHPPTHSLTRSLTHSPSILNPQLHEQEQYDSATVLFLDIVGPLPPSGQPRDKSHFS